MKARGVKKVTRSEEHVVQIANEDLVALLRRALDLPSTARLVAVVQTRYSPGEELDLDDEHEVTIEARWETRAETEEQVEIGREPEEELRPRRPRAPPDPPGFDPSNA